MPLSDHHFGFCPSTSDLGLLSLFLLFLVWGVLCFNGVCQCFVITLFTKHNLHNIQFSTLPLYLAFSTSNTKIMSNVRQSPIFELPPTLANFKNVLYEQSKHGMGNKSPNLHTNCVDSARDGIKRSKPHPNQVSATRTFKEKETLKRLFIPPPI